MDQETPLKHEIGSGDGESPSGYTPDMAKASATLMDWIGSFWSEVYSDHEFIKTLQEARGLRMSQLYLDLLEGLALQDRGSAPVFHRERWHPVVVRKSWRNVGSPEMFRLVSGGTVVLGDQTHPAYPEGTRITLGGRNIEYRDLVVYPLRGASEGLKGVATCLASGISGDPVVLSAGTGFMLLDGAIAVPSDQDPFTGENASKFPKFEVDTDDPDNPDEEVVLWACDAMFDKGFVGDHLGYVFGIGTESTEACRRAVNAVWDAVASGCSPLLLKSLMAAICGVPTVKHDGEVVERIDRGDDGILVTTDKEVYRLPPESELRKNVVPGAKLSRFDTLDASVKIYAGLNGDSAESAFGEFLGDLDVLKQDIPSLDLPPALFRSSVDDGFSVGWAEEDVTCEGFDVHGHPRLRFPIGGSDNDEDTFWQDTWDSYEESGVSMEDCLEGLNYDSDFKAGKVCARISPMRFFMRNLIGANTLVMSVRTDAIAEDSLLYDPRFFGFLRSVVPSGVRLYVIEHDIVGGESFCLDESMDSNDSNDSADSIDSNGDGIELSRGEDGSGRSGVSESTDMFAYDEYDEEFSTEGRGRRGARTRDGVDVKWVAKCRDRYDEY